MQSKSMLIIGKHTIAFTPVMINALLSYTWYFIYVAQTKLGEYQQATGDATGNADTVKKTQAALEQAKAIQQTLMQLQEEQERIYTWHFKQLASMFRKVRIELGYECIEDCYTLHMVVLACMDMLKAENPKFSREKFITFINNSQETK